MSRATIFVSYSHKDRDWLDRLQAHLGVFRGEGLVAAWSDESLRHGDDWPAEILAALDDARIAVLLVSANFLSSAFIQEKELPALLERRQQKRLQAILPLVITPCAWQLNPHLKGIEARPKSRDSVAGGSAPEQERDLADLTTQIARLLSEVWPPASSGETTGRSGGNDEDGRPGDRQTRVLAVSPAREDDYAVLEVRLSHREWQRYSVELAFTHSGGSEIEAPAPLGHCAAFDLDELLAIEDPGTYSERLRGLLFPAAAEQEFLRRARAVATQLGLPLRLRLAVDASARELHCLPWELLGLGLPEDNALSYESTYLVRYAGADVRARRDIRRRPGMLHDALLVAGIKDWLDLSGGVTPSDPCLEEIRAVGSLLQASGVEHVDVQGYVTLEFLKSHLRVTPTDVLYLCVGVPRAGLGTQAGVSDLRRWSAQLQDLPLAEAFHELESPPRLVILCPVVRNGTPRSAGSNAGWLSLLRESCELAETGVAGVLTAQAPLERAIWHRFLERFFEALRTDGRMDLALHGACAAIGGTGQQWAPVLISGLRTARVWYVARFTEETKPAAWTTLLSLIGKGACIPILGPDLNDTVARARSDIALAWADSYHYPMALYQRTSLPQVAQYVASIYGEAFLYVQYEAQLRAFVLGRFGHLLTTEQRKLPLDELLSAVADGALSHDPDEPHNLLASLPFPLYVTASLNSFLGNALRKAVPRKEPREIVLGLGEALGTFADEEPSAEMPLVYHLFGRLGDLGNSVLTEDNYFDFLIHFWRDRDAVSPLLRSRLTSSSLLFLGFRMYDWDFRVLLRTLLAQEGARLRKRGLMHVAVQVDPDDDQVTEPERAREYLENYLAELGDTEINVYWGTAQDFLRDLTTHWNSGRPGEGRG